MYHASIYWLSAEADKKNMYTITAGTWLKKVEYTAFIDVETFNHAEENVVIATDVWKYILWQQ